MSLATTGDAHRRRHLEMLLICTFALAASPLLSVGDDERVAVRFVPSAVLPPMCLSREWFGVSCPGCGLTRSFVHLAKGDVAASFSAHRLGWLLMAAAAFQIPYRLALLRGVRRFQMANTVSVIFSSLVIGLLILNWLLIMIGC